MRFVQIEIQNRNACFLRDIGLSLDFGRSGTFDGGPKSGERKQVQSKDCVVAGTRIGNISRGTRNIIGIRSIRQKGGCCFKNMGGIHRHGTNDMACRSRLLYNIGASHKGLRATQQSKEQDAVQRSHRNADIVCLCSDFQDTLHFGVVVAVDESATNTNNISITENGRMAKVRHPFVQS